MSIAADALEGRVALVTGAVGGLGSAIAEALAAAGAAVAVHHLGQPDEARGLAGRLGALGRGTAVAEADVRDWDQVEAMIGEVTAALGPIGVLVTNAGVMDSASFAQTSLGQWQRTIDIDLNGVFICSRLVAPGMLAAGRGVIVNVASQLAYKGAREFAAYCAAKGGVVSLTHALARELGPAIRVNAIAPGPVETPMIAPWADTEWRAERTRDSVLKRVLLPAEVAPVVAFLASDAAAALHGQVLHVNGGGVMA